MWGPSLHPLDHLRHIDQVGYGLVKLWVEVGCDFTWRFGLKHHHPAVGTPWRKWSVPAHLVWPPWTKALSETGHPLVDDIGQLGGQRRHDDPHFRLGHLLGFPFSLIQMSPTGTSYPGRRWKSVKWFTKIQSVCWAMSTSKQNNFKRSKRIDIENKFCVI